MQYHRRSIRLDGYDYSQYGAYFVTIDIQDKLKLFWNENKINDIGIMIEKCWSGLINRFNIQLDEYVIMPDHFHGILVIPRKIMAISLGEMIGTFKSISTCEYIDGIKNKNWTRFNKRLWQRDYYERIIRNEFELNNIREYIKNNPGKLGKI